MQQQLSEEQQKASDEAREAAVQAQTETLKHTSDNQRLSVRAEAAESDAKRSQQECQRLHAEYDHKVCTHFTHSKLFLSKHTGVLCPANVHVKYTPSISLFLPFDNPSIQETFYSTTTVRDPCCKWHCLEPSDDL